MSSKYPAALAATLLLLSAIPSWAAQFEFGDDANGINGLASATLTDAGVNLSLETTQSGAVLNEPDSGGLGIKTSDIPGVSGGSNGKFEVIAGTSPFTGEGEQLRLSFDVDGVLKEMDFDGVKDEDFEYFLLQTATSPDIYFFDSFNNSTADPNDIVIPPGAVLHFLQEDPSGGGSSPIDDKSFELFIPFTAGQEFLLTYGEQENGNGARFQGVTIQRVPEPAAAVLLAAVAGCVVSLRRRD